MVDASSTADGGTSADGDRSASCSLQGFKQALELLKGPTDERRFVGLLLAVNTMPQSHRDDLKVIGKVHEAAGPAFFDRLLLPLHRDQGATWGEEEVLKKSATCALGIAILSGLCQSPQLAASSHMTSKAPIFIKVVKCGGVISAMESHISTQESIMVDQNSVQDSLKCLVAIASASPEGAQAILGASGLPAVCQALQLGFTCQHLAAKLLVCLLNSPERERIQLEHAVELEGMVPPLANMLGALGDAAEGGKNADAASQQLDVLNAHLVLLPIAPGSKTELALQKAARGGEADWMVAARTGLHLLLRAKIDPSLRQAVLGVTAAYAQLASPSWLWGGSGSAFFAILVELVRVEITLLLRDALDPSAAVLSHWQLPTDTQPSPTQGEGQPFNSDGEGEAEGIVEGVDFDADRTPLEDHIAGQSRLQQMAQDSCRVDEMPEPITHGPGGGVHGGSAGERALSHLPLLLTLFEACLDALAEWEGQSDGSKSSEKAEKAVGRAMSSLAETAEALLQFLEEMRAQGRTNLMAVAATRALARFLAEVPFLEEKRVLAILGWLLQLQEGAAAPYLLQLLVQATAPNMPLKDRRKWISAAREGRFPQLLADSFRQLSQRQLRSDDLLHSFAVFANVADTGDMDESGGALHDDALLAEAVVVATKGLAHWAQGKLKPPAKALFNPASDELQPILLAYAGHICAMGLEVAGHQGNGRLSEDDSQHAVETMLAALHLGHVILELGGLMPRHPKATKEFLDHLASGEGGDMPMTEEESEFTDQLQQQLDATLVIYHRLFKTSPAFQDRAKQSEFYRHWGSGRGGQAGGRQEALSSEFAGTSLAR